jgi:hypothetical protein
MSAYVEPYKTIPILLILFGVLLKMPRTELRNRARHGLRTGKAGYAPIVKIGVRSLLPFAIFNLEVGMQRPYERYQSSLSGGMREWYFGT